MWTHIIQKHGKSSGATTFCLGRVRWLSPWNAVFIRACCAAGRAGKKARGCERGYSLDTATLINLKLGFESLTRGSQLVCGPQRGNSLTAAHKWNRKHVNARRTAKRKTLPYSLLHTAAAKRSLDCFPRSSIFVARELYTASKAFRSTNRRPRSSLHLLGRTQRKEALGGRWRLWSRLLQEAKSRVIRREVRCVEVSRSDVPRSSKKNPHPLPQAGEAATKLPSVPAALGRPSVPEAKSSSIAAISCNRFSFPARHRRDLPRALRGVLSSVAPPRGLLLPNVSWCRLGSFASPVSRAPPFDRHQHTPQPPSFLSYAFSACVHCQRTRKAALLSP